MNVLLTNKAKEKLLTYAKEMKKGHPAIRVALQGGCCGGSSYTMDFADKPESFEETFEVNGFKIFIDETMTKDLKDMKIDYLTQDSQHGFHISTPGKKKENCCGGGCGCCN